MIKERLLTVANYIEEGSLIDIGTDHGYLLIYLLKNNKLKYGLGVEVSKGPLDNLKLNLNKYGFNNEIKSVLSDGLKNISQNEIDMYHAISICGMGGVLISNILFNSKEKLVNKKLYLQPNNHSDKLRRTLNELNFIIKDEKIILDNNIYYEVLVCEYSDNNIDQLTREEYYFGPINLINKSDLFIAKYEKHLQHLMKINQSLIDNNLNNDLLISEINQIKGVINYENK